MKFKVLITFVFCFFVTELLSQDNVGIGTLSPDASAILDLTSTTKGLLLPRMTTTQRDAISSPATGLIIYNTTNSRYEYNSGTPASPNWIPIISNTSIGLNMPAQFSVTGSPVNNNGTFGVTWANQNQNQVLASPDGSNGTPTFRALTSNDIPNLNASKITAGTLNVAQGGTGAATLTGMLKGNGTSPISTVTATAGEITYWVDNNTIAGVSDITYDATNSILTLDGTFRHSPQASAPSSPSAGMTYYNSSNNKLYLYNGTTWIDLGEAGSGGLPTGTDSQTLRFNNTTLEATSLLRVTSSNVAIGSGFSPSATLHTDAGTATASFHKFTAGTTTGQNIGDGFDIGIDASGNAIIKNKENLPIIFATNDNTRMQINGGSGGVQIVADDTYANFNAFNIHNTYAGGRSIAMAITNMSTGNTANDGFRFGINGNGAAEITQKENQPLLFKINNNEVLKLDSSYNNRAKLLFNTSTIRDSVNATFGGDVHITGDLIVDGNIDPTSLTLIPQNSAPNTTLTGTMYYNNNDKKLRVYNGSSWEPIITSASASDVKRLNVKTVSSNYSVESNYDAIICEGSSNFNITLPSAVGLEGKVFYFSVKASSSAVVTINAVSGQKIDGDTSMTISVINEKPRISIVSDGSNWYFLSV